MRKQILILLGFSFSLIACQQNEEIGSVEDNANPNELTTRAASMRRVPTQAEKDNLKKDFPNLDVNNISVTGEAFLRLSFSACVGTLLIEAALVVSSFGLALSSTEPISSFC